MRAGNVTERRWWLAVAATLAAIYASLSSMQVALDALRERGLLRGAIVAAAGAAAAATVGWLLRRRAGWREWLTLAVGAAAYAAIASRLPIVQERIHLLQYGVVALLFLGALEARAGGDRPGFLAATSTPRAAGAGAVLLTAAAGWIDEGLQGWLPNRHYDLRDVVLNALAGGLAVGTFAGLRRARGRDALSATARRGGS